MAPDTPDNGFELLRAELREFRGELTATEERLRQQIAHVDVMAEDLKTKLDLVIKGVKGVDERLERVRGEVHGEFQQADRRFLRLEARILGRP